MLEDPATVHDGTPARTSSRRRARRQQLLRRQALVVSLALIGEYLLGAGVNLYVSVPDADHGVGVGSAIGKAISNGPVALAAHAALGLLLVVGALAVTAGATASRAWPHIALAVVALACIAGATVNGGKFVSAGDNASSMGMAVLTGLALACYVLIVFLARARDID